MQVPKMSGSGHFAQRDSMPALGSEKPSHVRLLRIEICQVVEPQIFAMLEFDGDV
jgi:hypothetical protein